MPDLTREEFDLTARQAGFDPADPHMDDLFPDVRLLLARATSLFEDDLTGYEPSSHHPPAPPAQTDA